MEPEVPCHPRLRRILAWTQLVSLTLAAILGGMALGSTLSPSMPTPQTTGGGTGTIMPGVTFVNPVGYANISFLQNQTFASQAGINGTTGAVWIDSVNLTVTKIPKAYPSATVNVSVWGPQVRATLAPVIVFTATAPAGSKVYFNLTGLPVLLPYALQVDSGMLRQVQNSTSSGFVSFVWSTWSSHTFAILFASTIQNGTGPPGTNATSPGPHASFTTLVNGVTVTFVDQSTDNLTGVLSYWLWDFGDGQNATWDNPVHTYSPGTFPPWHTYRVNLTVCDSVGLCSSVAQDVGIYDWPMIMVMVVIAALFVSIVAAAWLRYA